MGGGRCLGRIREGGAQEFEAELEWHVERRYDRLYLLSVTNVHILDVVASETVKE